MNYCSSWRKDMSDIGKVDYDTKIPNNVQLSSDRTLQRALESWQPQYLQWWKERGPDGFQDDEVYLRTAVSVDPEGWAKFDYVKMPEYRWGILLAPKEEGRTIPCGSHAGEPAWQEVPGEYRAMLRRLIVVQADTEPASVEQQRYLGKTAPSLFDMRNLFQVNVEEGRHLWAMVYLLHKYFGRDGREEALGLLERSSGDQDKPRILGAFNEKTPDWLSFFMFTCFTDRDGKFQLEALAQSGFDPLSRTCRFMLTEEGHHLFVGRTGIDRIVKKTSEVLKEANLNGNDIDGARGLGVIDLPTIQKKINFHIAVTSDLYGSEISTNAANAFNAGLKGRFRETAIKDDHKLMDSTYPVLKYINGAFVEEQVPALNALNGRLCDDYLADCQQVLNTWNKTIKEAGIDYELKLPHKAFMRAIGEFANMHVSINGDVMTEDEWNSKKDEWLPSELDLQFLLSLMEESSPEPGEYAGWIAPPKAGINGQPVGYEYVKLHQC
jgi:benzoyl-CoA 2,3-dioxygenase component B